MAETFEPVDFRDVHDGDRLRFVTADNGFNGRGLIWRTGRVIKKTEKTARVECDTAGLEAPERAVLRRDGWHARAVSKAAQPQTGRV